MIPEMSELLQIKNHETLLSHSKIFSLIYLLSLGLGPSVETKVPKY